jgi:tRNA nucleotidyltransferase (CCA-adding enzyme)
VSPEEVSPRFPELPKRTVVIHLRGNYESLPRDSLLGKLRSAADRVIQVLEAHGFQVLRQRFYTDETENAVIFIELEEAEKSIVEPMRGPYAWQEEGRTFRFLIKRLRENGYAWVNKDGVLVGVRRRKYVKATDLLKDLLKDTSLVKGTKQVDVMLAREARGWVGIQFRKFSTDIPAWILCL